MDIKNNRSLNRKATYISALSKQEDEEHTINKQKLTIFSEKNKNTDLNVKLPLNRGFYIRQLNKNNYRYHHRIIKKTIQINSGNRNIKYYPSPYNFTTHIEFNNIGRDETNNEIYITPFIQNKLPPIKTINLINMIIPNNYYIQKKLFTISSYENSIEFKNNLQQLLDTKKLLLNSGHIINNDIYNVVNITQKKINIIKNYFTDIVYCYSIVDNTVNNDVYVFTINKNISATQNRSFNLCIKELNDKFEYNTDNEDDGNIANVGIFKIFPKSLKSNFLYANTRKIEKKFENENIKTKKLSIKLLDNVNNDIKMNNLDYDVTTTNCCICLPTDEVKNYSCSCNYILHPLNPLYQIFMNFEFTHEYFILNEPEL